jgi:Na+/proline symporter
MDLKSMFPLFTTDTGIMVLAVYAAIVFGLTWMFASGYAASKEGFFVARRELNGLQGAMSTGAAWMWAPGMFIAAQQAYMNGLVGLFWFCIGNFLSLIFFSWFAKRLRDKKPDGFTISGYLKEKFSKRVQGLFIVELSLLAMCSFAINVLAGSKSVEVLTGMNYHWVSVILAAIALTYAVRGGLKASVVTEMFKLSVLVLGLLFLVPWAVNSGGGWSVVSTGLGGVTGNGASIFGTEFALGVFMGFGFMTALGHMGAPWGDNAFYQRAFAIKKDRVMPAFIGGAFIFIITPLLTGMLGFLAAGMGYDVPKELLGYTNILTVGSLLPAWAAILYLFMLFAGLVSVLDSQLSSMSNIWGHDVKNIVKSEVDDDASIKFGRFGMLFLILAGLAIANWPGMTLQTIFLFFGILRATVWFPVMFSLLREDSVSERGMFWGVLIAYAVGFTTYVYGQNWGGGPNISVLGTCLAVFGSGALALTITKLESSRRNALA